jgi:hypothetical protein
LAAELTPKDFPRRHPFNSLPGTDRLLERRDGVTLDNAAVANSVGGAA